MVQTETRVNHAGNGFKKTPLWVSGDSLLDYMGLGANFLYYGIDLFQVLFIGFKWFKASLTHGLHQGFCQKPLKGTEKVLSYLNRENQTGAGSNMGFINQQRDSIIFSVQMRGLLWGIVCIIYHFNVNCRTDFMHIETGSPSIQRQLSFEYIPIAPQQLSGMILA